MWMHVIVNIRFQDHFQGHEGHQGQECRFLKFISLNSIQL